MAYDFFIGQYEEYIQNYSLEGQSSSASVASRTPLQLALMISPLYLFMTRRLSRKSFHRGLLIDMAARLGPHKPPLLLSVEELIWNAVFKLAEGPSSVYNVLNDLANSLPWSGDTGINEELNYGTEQWFIPIPCMLTLF